MSTSTSKDDGQIERILSLAYLLSTRDEIAIDELEERFAVGFTQIEDDLNQLMYCGLPPYSPEQLFDISIEDGFVSMFYNDIFVAPLKLNDSERTNATVALTRLREESNIAEQKQIDDILKIINSTKQQVLDIKNSSDYFDLFQKAIDTNAVVLITYLSLNSGSIDDREIEPKKIFTTPSSSYIHAFCRRDKMLKLFRTDRITRAQLVDELAVSKEIGSNIQIDSEELVPFISDEGKKYVIFQIDDKASWVTDTFAVEEISNKDNHYKIFISNPFVAARIMLNSDGHAQYVDGNITKSQILDAVKIIMSRLRT